MIFVLKTRDLWKKKFQYLPKILLYILGKNFYNTTASEATISKKKMFVIMKPLLGFYAL